MIKYFSVLTVLILFFTHGSAQELDREFQDVVTTFMNCIQDGDIENLKDLVSFPLSREYPLPPVKSEVDFEERYAEIFDEYLIKMIVDSDVTKDWSLIGWRGIMLNNGALWLDIEGKLIAVNYQSNMELIKLKNLIEEDRNSIHSSLRNFEKPILIMETEKFRIRIDQLDGFIRYASWSKHLPMSEKPSLVMDKGNWIPDGTGGNHRYVFVNGIYKYECAIFPLREKGSSAANLIVYKNDVEIISQPAQILNQ